MKLRINGNSLRLRLNRSDVEQIGADGRVSSHVCFGPGPQQRLEYALEASDEADRLAVRYEPGRITVLLPRLWAQEWVETDRVGFEAEQVLEGGGTLRLLVEKDFACLHRGNEKQDPVAYPHPATTS